jgi:alpha-mannosidase
MKFQELLVLLPCHSLEDFPTYHEGEEAQGLLVAWTALWHPALIASVQALPSWQRVDDPPQELQNRLVLVPPMCVQRLPTGYAQRAKEEGACLIRKTLDRQEVLTTALTALDDAPQVHAELVADFLALGYAYLQIQLLTRQMRYSSNLDVAYFQSQVVAAANAAVAGDETLTKEKLSACFSVLAEERDHYYPVDAYLLDIRLVAGSTRGTDLTSDLTGEVPLNLLASGEALSQVIAKDSSVADAITSALAANRIGLIGGEAIERRLPLLGPESILAGLKLGGQLYKSLIGVRPTVFGRWRFGLTPQLPQILTKLGYQGALHASFEDGKTPDGVQFKIRWEGLDGSAIDAAAKTPLDASLPQTFLGYAVKLGETMDADHVATVALARWIGQPCMWHDDLRRIARYTAALGKFVTVNEYFSDTTQPGQLDRFEADRYRAPYLKQAVIRKHEDPISTSVRYWQCQAILQSLANVRTLDTLLSGKVGGALPEAGQFEEDATSERRRSLGNELEQALADLASLIRGKAGGSPDGYLAYNPCSYVRRMAVDVSALGKLPTIEKPIYAADAVAATSAKVAIADVPPSGFVWIGAGKGAAAKPGPLLAEAGVLRNEFFEAMISPTFGTLTAFHDYQSRGNRLSQQLALRMPGARPKPGDTYRDPDELALYSVMAADSVEVTAASSTLGEITCRGRLVDHEGKKLAGYVQTYRAYRGSRVLQIEIDLDPVEEPKADVWNSYFCARFAWADPAAEVYRAVNMVRQPAATQKIEAPLYLSFETEKHRTVILTGGVPFHRRHGERMLDSILITRGERARKFRLGIGLDLAHPLHEAWNQLLPPTSLHTTLPATGPGSGWLFHIDARNVVATHWSPLVESDKVVGFRARLLETEGRPAKLALSAFREISAAQLVDFRGEKLKPCEIDAGRVKLELSGNEWVEIEARW